MKQFDFEQVGQRMPSNVPDGFFDKLVADVMEEVGCQKNEDKAVARFSISNFQFSIKKALFAIAASVVLFFVVKATLPKHEAVDFESVELAFNNLSTEDQEYLLLVYEQDDLFINEIDEEE